MDILPIQIAGAVYLPPTGLALLHELLDPDHMIIKNFSVLSFIALGHLSAHAQETANVLPQSIVRGRLVTVLAPGVSNQFNNEGKKESLTAAYDGMELKMADMAAIDPAAAALKGHLDGINRGLAPMLDADFDVKARLNVQQFTTAFEYGINSKLSLGVIVPVVKVESTAHFNRSGNEQSAIDAINAVSDSDLPPQNKQALINGINAYAQATSTEGLGYTSTGSSNFTGLGDIEVGGKYQFYKENDITMAFQAGARLPTASHRADQKNLFDRSSGDGQLDLAVQWMGEYRVNSNLFLGSSAKLTAQLADHEDRYVKRNASDLLANLNDESLRDPRMKRNLGDTVDAEASINYEFADDQIKTWAVYNFSASGKDNYSGDKGLDYASLSKNTESISHRMALGLGYTTVPAFQRKKFAVPMEVKASYSLPFAGKNISNSKYSRLDLIVYF